MLTLKDVMGRLDGSLDRTAAAAPTGSSSETVWDMFSTKHNAQSSEVKLDDVLARINERLHEEYTRVGIPAEDRMISMLGQDTTKDAIRDATKARRLLGQVDDRNNSRYGVNLGTVGRRGYTQRSNALDTMRAKGDAGNTAILADEDFRIETLQDLINHGTSIRNSAQSGLGVAASGEANRDSAYAAAKSQAKSERNSTIGSLVGIGLASLI